MLSISFLNVFAAISGSHLHFQISSSKERVKIINIGNYLPVTDILSSPLDEIIERATIIPVQQSKHLHSASTKSTTDPTASLRSTAGSLSHSLVRQLYTSYNKLVLIVV